MLWPLHISLFSHLSIYHLTFIQLQLAHLSFVVINCIIASFLRNRQSIEYLGQVNMLALIAILLLIPVMIVNNLIAYKSIYRCGLPVFFDGLYYQGIFQANEVCEYLFENCYSGKFNLPGVFSCLRISLKFLVSLFSLLDSFTL